MKTFAYKHISVSYSDTGKGAVVVLLHGFLENKSMWDNYITPFSIKHRVIAIDLLGHGETSCTGYIHTMEDQADMIYELLHSLKIRKTIIIGHSMGGYIALAFAELYPDFIKGLVLLNSTSRADSIERKANRDRAILAVKQNYIAAVSMSIANLFSEKNRKVLLDEIEAVKTEALKTPLQGIVAAQEGMKIRKDREVLLHLTNFPIMLILGKEDPVLNYEENHNQVHDTKVELVTLNDGHMSHIENKTELLLILNQFLKKVQ